LDQTLLPGEQKIVELKTIEVADAIKNMIVRGAPAIGVTAAYGVAIASKAINTDSKEEFFAELAKVCDIIKARVLQP